MTDPHPRWEIHIDEVNGVVNETHLVWRSDDLPIAEWYWLSSWENPDEAANTMPEVALAALVAAVRDADTLRQARRLAQEVLAVPFSAYHQWHEYGDAEAADRMSEWEQARNALRALLFAPVSSDTPTPGGQT